MKRYLVIIGTVLCLLGLTACGKSQEAPSYMTNEEALALGTQAAAHISGVVSEGTQEMNVANIAYQGGDASVYGNAYESWSKAKEDLGDFLGVGELLSNTVTIDVLGNPADGALEVEILGSEHDAVLEVLIEDSAITSMTTNVKYTFGESMKKAGLNTLLGMGTVFCVLILISLIISAFNLIPKFQEKFRKKPVSAVTEKAVDGAIAQIIEKEELSDDTELVAVIAASIAAYEGTSTDGFVVRSIRRLRYL